MNRRQDQLKEHNAIKGDFLNIGEVKSKRNLRIVMWKCHLFKPLKYMKSYAFPDEVQFHTT